jgi:hypothetical protein
MCLLAVLFAPAQIPALAQVGTAPSMAGWSAQPGIHPAVARIVAPGNGSISYGSGTLVYVDEQAGLVITNWHVVNEATGPISVHFSDGFYSLGSIQRVDRDWDLAAIVIRKPNATPVRLAGSAPRPGEMLTIAGYGSGSYRAASGPCTQYVAPGATFPFEMVELAASARQGDSGGPIFNSRGELAGVLFGEGQGRTSGSYCGRVRWFLSSVVPGGIVDPGVGPGRVVPSSIASVAPRESNRDPNLVSVGPLKPVSPRPAVSDLNSEAAPVTLAQAPIRRMQGAAAPVHPAAPSSTPPAAAVGRLRAAGPPLAETQSLGWQDLAGTTLGDQVKTVLAGVGALLILLHALRWLGREPAVVK